MYMMVVKNTEGSKLFVRVRPTKHAGELKELGILRKVSIAGTLYFKH
jgi:hypothetical protein